MQQRVAELGDVWAGLRRRKYSVEKAHAKLQQHMRPGPGRT
jgi:hypothetical protein